MYMVYVYVICMCVYVWYACDVYDVCVCVCVLSHTRHASLVKGQLSSVSSLLPCCGSMSLVVSFSVYSRLAGP